MKFKQTFLLLSLLLISCYEISFAQQLPINTNPYWKGEITLIDGTIKTGQIMVPYSPSESYIAFRPAENGKKETFRRKEIQSITVSSPNGKKYYYEKVPIVMTFNGGKSYSSVLLLVYKRNNYATIFRQSGVYEVDSKTNEIYSIYRYTYGKDVPSVQYFINKRGEEKAYILCMSSPGMALLNSKLRKSAALRLTENPELLRRIMDKELGHRDIEEIIDTYLESTKLL